MGWTAKKCTRASESATMHSCSSLTRRATGLVSSLGVGDGIVVPDLRVLYRTSGRGGKVVEPEQEKSGSVKTNNLFQGWHGLPINKVGNE